MKTKRWTLLAVFLLATTLGSVQLPLAAQVSSGITVPVAPEGVTVRLVNQTDEPVTYEALGDTQSRLLSSGDDVILRALNTPATLTFFYQDIQKDPQTGTGLLQTELSLNEATGVLDVTIRPTNSLDADVSNITVEPNGDIFMF
ncbi:MAG: hypothetical protein AAF282_07845 [Cyanobacteria bacterium P01_A01_bin.15]